MVADLDVSRVRFLKPEFQRCVLRFGHNWLQNRELRCSLLLFFIWVFRKWSVDQGDALGSLGRNEPWETKLLLFSAAVLAAHNR